jgi:hypothetical protein
MTVPLKRCQNLYLALVRENTLRYNPNLKVRNAFRNESVMFACYSTIKILSNTRVANGKTILASRKRRKNMYYRVAIQADASPTWQWKSTTLSSLDPLFQFLRRFHDLPQDHLRVFSSASRDELGEQLVGENNGLGSHSVTAAQFLQERMLGSQQGTSTAMSTRLPEIKSRSEIDARTKSAVSSPESGQVGQEHRVSKVGFWNIMALVEA